MDLAETRRRLEESNAVQTEALKRHADMQQELENNAGHFTLFTIGLHLFLSEVSPRSGCPAPPLWNLPAQHRISILDLKAVQVQ